MKENGPVVPRPWSEVPTAFPEMSVNRMGETGFPLELAW